MQEVTEEELSECISIFKNGKAPMNPKLLLNILSMKEI
jgi:hypothetical protein